MLVKRTRCNLFYWSVSATLWPDIATADSFNLCFVVAEKLTCIHNDSVTATSQWYYTFTVYKYNDLCCPSSAQQCRHRSEKGILHTVLNESNTKLYFFIVI